MLDRINFFLDDSRSFCDLLHQNISIQETPPYPGNPPLFSGAGFLEIQDLGQKGGFLDPEVPISRGESAPQAKNFGVFRALKC